MKITNYDEDYGPGDEYRQRVLSVALRTSVAESAKIFNVGISTIYYWRKAAREFNSPKMK